MRNINKLFLMSMTIFLMLFLSACAEVSGTPIQPNENNMIINFKNNSNFDFYGVEVKIRNHTSGIVNADGSMIEKGQEFRFEFLEEDFELVGEAEIEVFILTDNNIEDDGDRIPINKKVTLQLVKNKEVLFELIGDSINEAEINRVSSN